MIDPFITISLVSHPLSGNELVEDNYKKLPKILIPTIRREFPQIVQGEIVGVKPMGGPLAELFKAKYDN